MNQMQELINIVNDALENETAQREYNREIRRSRNLPYDAIIDVRSLSAEEAYRLGNLNERCDNSWRLITVVCKLLDVDPKRLLAAVKSMNRWEKHSGRWDRGISPTSCLSYKDEKPLLRFVTNDGEDKSYYQSTGRKKAWCE